MRKYMWLVGLTLGMAWAGSANAQFTKTVNIMPSFTNNSPMDYRNQIAPVGGPSYRNSGFKMNQLFYTPSRPNTFGNTVVNGQSVFPSPIQMQAAAPSYFRSFQMYRAGFIQP